MGSGTGAATAACTPCRTVKMRCTREPDSTICNRCQRKSLQCFYESHRRGRKPGTKLRPKAERKKPSTTPNTQTNPLEDTERTTASPQPIVKPGSDFGSTPTMQTEGFQHSTDMVKEESHIYTSRETPFAARTASAPQTTRPAATDSLAPFALLRKSTTPGNYTIANILNADDDEQGGDETSRMDDRMTDDWPIDINDPVNENLLSLPIAHGLFDNFFKYMNPLVCQFDPVLHTLPYIRSRSSFLFTTLLRAAAKVFCPTLYQSLHDHLEKLLHKILGKAQKSPEIVQAICLMTHWKESSDSRAWMFIGYAIRACLEMGWHKLKPTNLDDSTMRAVGTKAEIEIRERRNKERTWLMLFVYDRSVSLQLGKPSMVQMDPIIRNVENWHKHKYAVSGVDENIVAFAELRTIGFELLDMFWLESVTITQQGMNKDQYILRHLNENLDRWVSRWHKIIDEADADLCQRFLIRFYGHHLRLILHTFGLQISITNGSVSKQSLWVCYASAYEMMRLVIDRLGTISYLYYCQDSVHVMVAYAAVVAIKILLSFPGELPGEAENQMLTVFMEASEYFGRQCSTMNTSCYHQSRFLANVVTQYRRSKERAHTPMKMLAKQPNYPPKIPNSHQYPFIPQQQQQQQQATYPPSSHSPHSLIDSSIHPQLYPSSNAPSAMHMPVPAPEDQTHNHNPSPNFSSDTAATIINKNSHNNTAVFPMSPSPSNIPNTTLGIKQQHSDNQSSINQGIPTAAGPSFPKQNGSNIGGEGGNERFESFVPAVDGQNNSYPFASFTDNGAWEDLFAHAGFSITSGVFVPNPSGS